jgi:hypothetical protein
MGKTRNTYRVLTGMPEVKRPLGKRRPRREVNNIKINFREAVLEDVDRIKLSQDRNC